MTKLNPETVVLLTSAGGGHAEQLSVLTQYLIDSNDQGFQYHVFVEKGLGFSPDLRARTDSFSYLRPMRSYKDYIRYIFSRDFIRLFKTLVSLGKSSSKGVAISTGGFHGFLVLLVCKITCPFLIIYIETVAKRSKLSRTGRLTRLFADDFYVQSPQLSQKLDGTVYHGTIY